MNTIKFEKGQTLAVAHRGLSGIERENTIAAFIAAGNRSYYGVETDIRRTADGHFVICHDKSLLRISGEEILVEETPLKELQEVILYDEDGTKSRKDLRLCTLENYIRICKKYEKHCVLELKSDFDEEETDRYLQIIRDLEYLEHVTFISFKYENLLRIRKRLPEQSVQYLFFEATEEILQNLLADRIDVDAKHTTLTEELIKTYHNAGLKVNCWTVDDKEIAERLVRWGVDYITTNILE